MDWSKFGKRRETNFDARERADWDNTDRHRDRQTESTVKLQWLEH